MIAGRNPNAIRLTRNSAPPRALRGFALEAAS
jgi:hypothetical protein